MQIGNLQEQLSILRGLQHLYHFNNVQAAILIVLDCGVGLRMHPGRCSCGLAYQYSSWQSMMAKERQQLQTSGTSFTITLQSSRCGYSGTQRPRKPGIIITQDFARRPSKAVTSQAHEFIKRKCECKIFILVIISVYRKVPKMVQRVRHTPPFRFRAPSVLFHYRGLFV